MKRFVLIACALLLMPVAIMPAHAQQPTFTCPAGGGSGTLAGGLEWSCPAPSPAPPTITCPTGQHVSNGVCVNDVAVDGCDSSQLSTTLGTQQLLRQCVGSVKWGNNIRTAYPGVTDLVAATTDSASCVESNRPPYNFCKFGPWPNLVTGKSMVIPITIGYYVSMKFVATNDGQMQLATNPTYGNGGQISISTVPGAFSGPNLAPGNCSYESGFGNNLWAGMNGADCVLTQGNTYFLNFADASVDGGPAPCFNTDRGSCTTSQVSYTLQAGH